MVGVEVIRILEKTCLLDPEPRGVVPNIVPAENVAHYLRIADNLYLRRRVVVSNP